MSLSPAGGSRNTPCQGKPPEPQRVLEVGQSCWGGAGTKREESRLSQAGPPAQSPVHSEQRTSPVPFQAREKVPREGEEYPALHGLSREGVANALKKH